MYTIERFNLTFSEKAQIFQKCRGHNFQVDVKVVWLLHLTIWKISCRMKQLWILWENFLPDHHQNPEIITVQVSFQFLVREANIRCWNGYVHFLDRPLIPRRGWVSAWTTTFVRARKAIPVFPKIGWARAPQIINLNRVFHYEIYKPSISGYPYFWKHPYNSRVWHVPAAFRFLGFLSFIRHERRMFRKYTSKIGDLDTQKQKNKTSALHASFFRLSLSVC